MTKRYYISHKKPHYYINPVTGRLIKSDSKTFRKLKTRKFIIQKDACLYDINSAKKCLSGIISKYNGLVYPSSNFTNILSTYHKSFKAKGFVKNNQKTHINGFIDKKGYFKKLNPEILLPKHKITEIVSLEHYLPILNKKVKQSESSTKDEYNEIKQQIKFRPKKQFTMLFNPIQNDIIPVDNSIPEKEYTSIINQVNKDLIPNELPTVKETTVSGFVVDSILKPIKIIGFTNTQNETKRLEIPIHINESSYNTPDYLRNEIESINYKIPDYLTNEIEIESISYNTPDYLHNEIESISYNTPDYLHNEIESINYKIPDYLTNEIESISYNTPDYLTNEIESMSYNTPDYLHNEIESMRYNTPDYLHNEIEIESISYNTPDYLTNEIESMSYNTPDYLHNEIEIESISYNTPDYLHNEIESISYNTPGYLHNEIESINYKIPDYLHNEIESISYNTPGYLHNEIESIDYKTPDYLHNEIESMSYNTPEYLHNEIESISYNTPEYLHNEIESISYNTPEYLHNEIESMSYNTPDYLDSDNDSGDSDSDSDSDSDGDDSGDKYNSLQYFKKDPEYKKILGIIPQVQISRQELYKLPLANKNEEEEFREDLDKICGYNELLDDNKNCNSCEYYDLVWDIESNKCKKIDKRLSLVLDEQQKIQGYMDLPVK